MKIFIYGAWENGLIALNRIKERYDGDIEGFIDLRKKGEYSGYTIYEIENVPKDALIIFAHDNIIKAAEMYENIMHCGFEKLYWFMNLSDELDKKRSFVEDECFPIKNWGECVLPNMELHISDKCNLNCKNCTHFSPLYNEIGVEFDKCIDDVKTLRSYFTNIGRLDILGGEPLLSSELDKYIETLRDLLPDTYLNIFTNGLLIPKLSDEVLKVIKSNDVTVTISEYPPIKIILDQIILRLKNAGIRYRITTFRDKFNIPITIAKETKHPYKCISDGCICVADGKVARCPTLMYVHRFNEVYGTELPEDGILDLHDCPKGKELLEILKKDVPLCRHCIECETEWSVCGNEIHLEDFAVRD